jgi:hypothetical protein
VSYLDGGDSHSPGCVLGACYKSVTVERRRVHHAFFVFVIRFVVFFVFICAIFFVFLVIFFFVFLVIFFFVFLVIFFFVFLVIFFFVFLVIFFFVFLVIRVFFFTIFLRSPAGLSFYCFRRHAASSGA